MASNAANRASLPGKIVWLLAIISAIFQTATAIAHLYNELDDVELEWSDDGEPIDETTTAWRSIFTFKPDTLCDVWTPVIFALLAVSQLVPGLQYGGLTATYLRCTVFHVVMALFGAWGYAGNLGIITGAVEIVTGAAALVAHLLFPKTELLPTRA